VTPVRASRGSTGYQEGDVDINETILEEKAKSGEGNGSVP
jgi:hypothetical protein